MSDFWQEKVQWAEDGDKVHDPRNGMTAQVARAGGWHYLAYPGGSSIQGFRGFGGSPFTFRFHDGRVLTSTNVWCQGEIPAEYRDRLPDNAEIVNAEIVNAEVSR